MLGLKSAFYSRVIILSLCGALISANRTEANSESLTGERGLFRAQSAAPAESGYYQFKASLEYFKQDGIFNDLEDSSVERTRSALAMSYAINKYFFVNGHTGFDISTRTPKQVGAAAGSEAINLVRSGVNASGFYDIGTLMGLNPKKLLSALSLWIDLSKITRMVKGPNIIPTLVFSSELSNEFKIPFWAHLNFSLLAANGERYYNQSDNVKDFDRFATQTYNNWGYRTSLGIEMPFRLFNPSVEYHLSKMSKSGLSKSPQWITVGLKAQPFPQRNINVFFASDIGLSSYTATPTGAKPENPATPLWNVIVGFGVSKFGVREGQVSVNETDLSNLKSRLNEAEQTLQSIKNDIEYNVVQGRVLDAVSKQPIDQVEISFPESPDLKIFKTNSDGSFLRYFRSLTAARITFIKEGYESSSKFLSLKPGEKLSLDVELRREIPGQSLADFVATILNQNGEPLVAEIKLFKEGSDEVVTGSSDNNGQLYLKVPVGNYKIVVSESNSTSIEEPLGFEKGRAVIRSYTLSPKTQEQ